MKFIHLSDLHIGKRVHEFPMLEDQEFILGQILGIVKDECADGVILAGDVYDKPVPSGEAVRVFDRFLTELAKMEMPVFIISGNHDSPERLSFGAQLMSGRGVYFSPVYDGKVQKVCFEDAYGEVCIWLLPFLKPATVRHALGIEAESYQEALELAIGHMEVDFGKRNLLVAHQFVTGAAQCDSEVSVGGLDQVSAAVFDGFDYVALGHIHSPQSVGRESVRYCGTPLKYSFSEAGQEKSVTVAELREKGDVQIWTVPLKPRHDMRKARGTYLEVTARSFYEGTDVRDYLQVTLTDEEDIPDGMQKLRVIYPNLMRLEYDNKRTRENRVVEQAAKAEEKSELELFQELYELQNNQPMTLEQVSIVSGYIQELQEGRIQG